jgi:glutathione peroxidase
MRILQFLLPVLFLLAPLSVEASTDEEKITMNQAEQTLAGAYQFSFVSIDGKPMPLSDFKGKVMLIVNTASQCGFTKQYEDLQHLHKIYKEDGLVVIGVPCNNFGGQEPGDANTIKDFIETTYGVTFPMTQKYDVKGENIHPFFEWATSQKKGGLIFSSPKWNFHKFLIGRDGQLYKSYGSQVSPTSEQMKQDIESLLAVPQ